MKGKWIMSGSLVFGLGIGALAATSTTLIPLVFGNLSGSARMMTGAMVLVIACYLPLWTLLNAQFALSRAGGDTAMGVWVDVGVTYYLVFIPLAWALSALTPIGPVALFGWSKLTDVLKTCVAGWWLKKGRWVRNPRREERFRGSWDRPRALSESDQSRTAIRVWEYSAHDIPQRLAPL